MAGAVVRHHRGVSLDAGSPKRIFLIERNRVLLAAKLFPWSLLLMNPYYFSLRLASGVLAAAGEKGEMARSRASPINCGLRGPSCARTLPPSACCRACSANAVKCEASPN
jgi:hypothetical protein